MPEAQQIRANRDIEQFILSARGLYADREWLMEQWEQYAAELSLAAIDKSGVLDLIKQRKQAQSPRLITNGLHSERSRGAQTESYYQEVPPESIAHLTLTGVMRSTGGISTRGVNELVDDIRYAYNHPNIEGIIIEANTGGGEAIAGQMLNGALENAPKAVVVYAHFLASAGVMGTLPADEIILSGASAQAGSVGTYITLRKGAADFYKENYTDIYASKSSRKNEGFRSWLEGNLEPLRKNIDEFNETFLSQVEAYRPIKKKYAKELQTGAMFMANDAKKIGLADGVGGFQYALKRLNANIKRRKNS